MMGFTVSNTVISSSQNGWENIKKVSSKHQLFIRRFKFDWVVILSSIAPCENFVSLVKVRGRLWLNL